MNPTEGAFLRLCRSLTLARVFNDIAAQEVASLRAVVVAALHAEADKALRVSGTLH